MDNYKVSISGHEMNLKGSEVSALDMAYQNGVFHILDGNKTYKAELKSIDGKQVKLLVNNILYTVDIADEVDQVVEQLGMDKVAEQAFDKVKAPMPGLILEILVTEGQSFEAGEPLLILEAMKMENIIKAEGVGTVKRILFEKGATVDKNQVIIEMV